MWALIFSGVLSLLLLTCVPAGDSSDRIGPTSFIDIQHETTGRGPAPTTHSEDAPVDTTAYEDVGTVVPANKELVAEPDTGLQPKPAQEKLGQDTLALRTERGEAPLPAADDAVPPIGPDALCTTLISSAQANDLPLAFFTKLIWQESGFRPNVVSRAGAQGIAQFMPKVAVSLGLDNPFDPFQALPASAQLLRSLFQQFGNFGLAAAAYNAGPKRVLDWLSRRGKLPQETRSYVLNITGQPAEKWRSSKTAVVASKLPDHVPCRNEAVAESDDVEPLQTAVQAQPQAAPKNARALSLIARAAGSIRLASASNGLRSIGRKATRFAAIAVRRQNSTSVRLVSLARDARTSLRKPSRLSSLAIKLKPAPAKERLARARPLPARPRA